MTTSAQRTAMAYVEARKGDLSAWTKHIFDLGETAWREYESAAWYVALLRREGFAVEEGSAGMPTAFAAQWSNGAGPAIGMYAEYDAVPGNCQDATTAKRPRPGLSEHAGGHPIPIRASAPAASAGCSPARRPWSATA
jgi:aminobenzoyl-glutamate utilization protein B